MIFFFFLLSNEWNRVKKSSMWNGLCDMIVQIRCFFSFFSFIHSSVCYYRFTAVIALLLNIWSSDRYDSIRFLKFQNFSLYHLKWRDAIVHKIMSGQYATEILIYFLFFSFSLNIKCIIMDQSSIQIAIRVRWCVLKLKTNWKEKQEKKP